MSFTTLYLELSENFETIGIKPSIRGAKQIQLIYVGGTNGSVLSDVIDENQSYSNFVSAEAKPTSNLSVIGHKNETDNPIFDIPRRKAK